MERKYFIRYDDNKLHAYLDTNIQSKSGIEDHISAEEGDIIIRIEHIEGNYNPNIFMSDGRKLYNCKKNIRSFGEYEFKFNFKVLYYFMPNIEPEYYTTVYNIGNYLGVNDEDDKMKNNKLNARNLSLTRNPLIESKRFQINENHNNSESSQFINYKIIRKYFSNFSTVFTINSVNLEKSFKKHTIDYPIKDINYSISNILSSIEMMKYQFTKPLMTEQSLVYKTSSKCMSITFYENRLKSGIFHICKYKKEVLDKNLKLGFVINPTCSIHNEDNGHLFILFNVFRYMGFEDNNERFWYYLSMY